MELINTLFILGAAQGLFLAVLLATKRTNSVANKLLAAAMLAFAVFLLQEVYYARGYYRAYPQLIGVGKPLVFAFGPLLYLYAQVVSAGGQSFRKASLLHLLPFALVTLYFVPFYLEEAPAKLALLSRMMRGDPPPDLAIIGHLQYPHGILYVGLTIALLRRHRARLRESHSSLERINLLWLRNLTIGMVAVWALATGLELLDVAGLQAGAMQAMLTPLAVSFLVYALGYLGLRQPEIFSEPSQRRVSRPVDARPAAAAAAPRPTAPPAAAVPPDAREGLTSAGAAPARTDAHLRQLARLMEEKRLFTRSGLTLRELADELSISARDLSAVINSDGGRNFYDFVNGYRVEEVKRRLRDPRAGHLTIQSIARDAGFDTRSTFNAFFRKHTGLTPSQYRARETEARALLARSAEEGAGASHGSTSDIQAAVGANYEIERELGRGGMATVFLARDRKHRRPVAVKVCRTALGTDDVSGARFQREIETAARLSHPHILPLHDSGVSGDLLWYVMPVVTGESLRERIVRDGRLPVADALRLTTEVAEALEYAHANGVVHRDIKPGNILISHGHALVADFGLARAIRTGAAKPDAALTSSGMVVGTPLYMSPEQFSGRHEVDGRADQYSLACVLYEMLCGVPPFTGETAEQVLVAHVADPIPSLAANEASAPPAVEAALARALAKNPADRFPTMGEFARVLSAAMSAVPAAAPAAAHSWRWYAAFAIDGVLWAALFALPVGLAGAHRLLGLPAFAVAMLGAALWIPIEGVLLWQWGTTPGQALLGVRAGGRKG